VVYVVIYLDGLCNQLLLNVTCHTTLRAFGQFDEGPQRHVSRSGLRAIICAYSFTELKKMGSKSPKHDIEHPSTHSSS
jgi:hypothetical protein